ncbi:SDR family NAD(P)-dependent oxidoreductase [Caballeronia cordobensis]|uniref:SDR family NAD(P)-dependent oxidoreductase n=1 Tax=Caballeronia cordobensis TaxID=1353886 RepID=UPI00045EE6DA|nr:putative membrane protein [Burkholderia sp. RPE67]
MLVEFENQVAVVTGAAQGLGRAISTLLCERGSAVVLVDRDEGKLRETTDALAQNGHRATCVVTDVTDEAALVRLRDTVDAQFGRLDVLVNNAGGWRYGSLADITRADWDWTFDLNVSGVFLATRTLMDLMIRNRYGRVVNIASTDAYRPKPTLPHYAAAKSAIVSLTRTMGVELAPHGVIVNAVSPGMIATETAKAKGWIEERIKAIPVGHPAEPEDIAEVVLFLASRRNRYVVGESVLANGGALMR